MCNNTEREFHTSRVPFAILNDEVVYTINDMRDHKDWLFEDHGVDNKSFELLVRGYCNNKGDIIIYRGSKFESIENWEEITQYILKIVRIATKEFNNIDAFHIYNGIAEIGKPGEIWKYGTKIMQISIRK